MQLVNIYQAKTQLSQLIQQAQQGQDVIIAKAGKPVVKVIPYTTKTKNRKPGLLKGQITISPDFDEEDEEINQLFYGSN